MSRSFLGELFRYLRRESGAAGQDLSDGALLERFLNQRDEVAFETLLERHGPMVLGVCQRVVGDTHAAEDAFQATFLVLARKAGSIRNQASVGSWLFGVAQRIAHKARTRAATWRDRERRAAEMPQTDTLNELTWQELRSILDEEIGRLPAKYQAAVVLCHLEGKSYDQAAQELGCPKSTLATRLAKALELLRGQLTRRGLALSAGALAMALTEKATAAPVPALLSINIMKTAASIAAGKPLAAGILSTQAIALAEEAMKTMIGIKMKLVALVLALGLAAGAGYAGYGAWVEQPPPRVDEKQPPVAKEQPAKKDPSKVVPGGWRHDGPVRFAAFLPDGKRVVTASSDGNIRVWEYPAGKEIRRIAVPEGAVKGMIALSTDGKMIAIAKFDETEICLIDLATSKQLPGLKWAAPEEKRQASPNLRLAFSPNGEHLAAQDRAGVVSIWDWAKGKKIRTFATGEGLRGSGLAYAPDGKSILTINDEKTQFAPTWFVKIWDPATEKEKCTIEKLGKGDGGWVDAVSFSPDSKNLAISRRGGIVIADTATGKQIRRLTNERFSYSRAGGLVFAKDGAKLYEPIDGKIVEYEVTTGKTLRQHQGTVGNPSLSPDGKTLIGGGKRLQFLDVSGKEIASLLDDADTASAEAAAYAVELVEKYGGKLLRDDKQPGKPVIGVTFSGGTGGIFAGKGGGWPLSWPSVVLKELKGFKQLTSLDLSRCRGVDGRGFSELRELKQLTTLDLNGTQVTDAGLKELKELKQLTSLNLARTKVTDEGLKELKELKQLKQLFLQHTKVTDAGVKELQEALPKCKINPSAAKGAEGDAVKLVENLGGKITRDDTQSGKPVIGVYLARNTAVTDADLKRLKEFKQLTTLDLKGTQVTDVWLKELKELKQLTKLYIGGNRSEVTDEGLKELKELKQLTTLGLGLTKVTDAGLKELKELRQLEELILIGCSGVTDAGIKELQKALPRCNIKR